MLKTTKMLIDELKDYKQPINKIQRMLKSKELYSVGNGFYETNRNTEPFTLASVFCAPSYISFETALAYYDLIPEAVYAVTSATCLKHKNKMYQNVFSTYFFSDIPVEAFPYGFELKILDSGYSFKIATKEKALCDMVYKKKAIRSISKMEELLTYDMRIDEEDLMELNIDDIYQIKDFYHSNNVNYLYLYLRRLHRNK